MNVLPNSSATPGPGAASALPRPKGAPAGCKFPSRARLLKHADFDRVYKTGKKHFSPHLTVFYRERAEGGARIGFTVGKVLGGAVVRNRIKRRLREATRAHLAGLSCAVDVVINPKKTALRVEFSELCAEVGRALEKIQKQVRALEP